MNRSQGEGRRQRILSVIRHGGISDVTGLAEALNVAPETIRRDLHLLEDHGLVRRTHGGAFPLEGAGYDPDLAVRALSGVGEKRRIAAAVMQVLGPAESIYLDEGYTPLLIAEELARSGRRQTVVTPSLACATALAGCGSTDVIQLGGRVRQTTLACADIRSLSMLQTFLFDVAILGSNGISPEHGLTVPSLEVAAMKAAAMKQSRRRLFVGVHTKFGVSSLCKFADISEFDSIITNTHLSPRDAQRYAALGPKVLRV